MSWQLFSCEGSTKLEHTRIGQNCWRSGRRSTTYACPSLGIKVQHGNSEVWQAQTVTNRANMSSPRSNSALEAKASIERSGFYLIKDAAEETDAEKMTGKGKLFAQFYNAGYYTKTPQGLDFVFQNTMGDTVRFNERLMYCYLTLQEIRSIVLSIIAQPRWGYLRYFSTRLSSEYAWFFHNRDESNGHEAIHTLLVQFWMPGSRVVYYEGSQSQFFDAKEDPDNWGVLKTPLNNMKRESIIARIEDMPNGG